MALNRRNTLKIIGGGFVAAAGAAAFAVTRKPTTALAPWAAAGDYSEPRMRALSWAILSPNPHNRQPWMVDLSVPDHIGLYVDTSRLLPHTDPFSRQIVIGLGCFLETLKIAASHEGYSLALDLFPEGSDPAALDARPVAIIRFEKGGVPDPLFAQIPHRRSNKEPYDTARIIPAATLAELVQSVEQDLDKGLRVGATVDAARIDELRALSGEALMIELETPRTYQESVDLFRIGHREVNANPDGLDFIGPLFETLHLTGQFTREGASDTSSFAYQSGIDAVKENTRTAMGHIWITTQGNTRSDQIKAGQAWMRLNLLTTRLGLDTQPLSQALQEYPEMAAHYQSVHNLLARPGETVQMWGRLGYGPDVAVSPRWPLEQKLV